jgi:hypothetical protein
MWSQTVAETQIPPGAASPSNRAAMLTASPKMSSPSAIKSPTLTPMRNRWRPPRRDPDRGRPSRAGFARTAHRVDHAGEFRQHTVAGGLDDPAVMLANLRIDELVEMRLETFVCAFFVLAHQPRITRHIGGEDRGETAGGGRSGHFSGGDNVRAEFNLLRAGTRSFHLGWLRTPEL